MPNEVNWEAVVWAEINEAVVKEVAKVRIAQKVFPTIVLADDPTEVINDVIAFPALTIQEGSTKPFVEIHREFELTSAQVSKEIVKKTGKTLARMAAKEIALAEDTVILQGTNGALPPNVRAEQRGSAAAGLVGEAAAETIQVRELAPVRPGVIYGENTFAAVTDGIARLNAKGQALNYALILPTAVYADTFVPPSPGSLVTTAERIRPLVEGGFYGTGTLPADQGLLVALGGEPTSLYVGREAVTEFVRKELANYVFRVVERVQFVARDARAFVLLNFERQQQQQQP
ncbi:encapsulin [Rhodococcus aetherivorans]|uniref:encapsulin n=1 Tax=Rhodococcus aetherivorans TaxID=191292 RepID=UPI002949BE45|nr:family 1 encapsulin nanocompartment shell protein [Rhodococcus aetherivorans]MDV6297235.1 family 1 encapsulin nanocompartment shell protein [Rhodococcus aetherivorans]